LTRNINLGKSIALTRSPTPTLKRCVERGTTVFLTSHVLEIVEKLCTDIGIISHGRIVHQGTMEELQRDGSLEDKFITVVGENPEGSKMLSWLE
jgi:ABC-2 type transport system ATP-binding protein